jgi:hypothetical protein
MNASTQTCKALPKLPNSKRQACPLRLALRSARRVLAERWIERDDRYAGILVEEAAGLIDLLGEAQRFGTHDPRLVEDRGIVLLCRMDAEINRPNGASKLLQDLARI